jgi:hypothetical protein
VNLITPATRKQAIALAKTGETVSLAHTLLTEKADDNASPFEHTMLRGNNMDRYAIQYHGYAHSHIDALCHILYKDQTYNGYARADVNTDKGCTKLGIQNLKGGLVTRGVLVDIPRLRNLPYLEPGTAIYVEDLEAWEKKAGVKIGPGDALLLRTGRWARREKLGPWNVGQSAAGLHASVAPWIKARGVSLLGSDAAEDVTPSMVESVALPVHTLMITGLGVNLLDNQDLEALGDTAARLNRCGVHAHDQPDAGCRRNRVSAQCDCDVLTGSRFRVQGSFWVRGSGFGVLVLLLSSGTRMSDISRRAFTSLSFAAAGSVGAGAQSSADDRLQSELLMDLILDTQPANNIGSIGVNRVIVPVSGGTFDGPKLKGTVLPGADWIVRRPDGSSVLDVRIILQTDDAQKIYMRMGASATRQRTAPSTGESFRCSRQAPRNTPG